MFKGCNLTRGNIRRAWKFEIKILSKPLKVTQKVGMFEVQRLQHHSWKRKLVRHLHVQLVIGSHMRRRRRRGSPPDIQA